MIRCMTKPGNKGNTNETANCHALNGKNAPNVLRNCAGMIGQVRVYQLGDEAKK